MTPLRLGLLSTARINDRVLEGAAASDAVDVVAVASRDAGRARAYADAHGVPRAHGTYEALLADPGVDAVYVSLPNALHVPWSIAALEAGKHVLCEKPLTRSAAEAERAFDAADAAGRVLMEAFMWRHQPQTRLLAELAHAGTVGRVRLVRCTFSFVLERAGDFRFDPAQEGGALMDVGCYCVSAIRLLAGEPVRARGAQLAGGGGVDLAFAGVLELPDGVLGLFDCALSLPSRTGLEVVGEEGTITVADPWFARAGGLEVRRGEAVEAVVPERANAYRLELENLAAAAAGTAAPLLGRADAVGQARALEALHASA